MDIQVLYFIFKYFRHLEGCSLPTIFKPSVLLIDSSQALSIVGHKKDRDEEFINLVLSNLRTPDGHVLLPISPVGRLLEILLLLESRWGKHRYPYPIYLVGIKMELLLDYIKSMLEWMAESLTKSFTSNRENPFDFK